MDRLIERIARAPLAAKAGVVVAIVALLTALNYFVVGVPLFGPSISDTEQRIARADGEQKKLDNDLIEKTAIANNLNQFRREKELLEQRLQEALAELPEEKKLDELLQLFQERARKAGLWNGPNPIELVDTRKVPKRAYHLLEPAEVEAALPRARELARELADGFARPRPS